MVIDEVLDLGEGLFLLLHVVLLKFSVQKHLIELPPDDLFMESPGVETTDTLCVAHQV